MSGVPGLEMHHGLMAARGGGNLLLALFHLFRWKPAVIAVVCWVLFAGCSAAAQISTRPDEVVENRYACSPGMPPRCALCPSASAVSDGAFAPEGCEGGGKVLASQKVSYRRQEGAASQGAGVFRMIAEVATIGAITVGLLGAAGAYRARRPSRIAAAARKVKSERDRARRDMDRAGKAATKLGQRRLEAAGRRWARQDAAGRPRTDLNRLDRLLVGKRVAPPKQKKQKGKGRKGRKALESEWASELARIDAARSEPEMVAHLDPSAGPPLPPEQSPSPQVDAWREQARTVEARTAGTMRGLVHTAHEANGWVGYTPPAAPVALTKEDVS